MSFGGWVRSGRFSFLFGILPSSVSFLVAEGTKSYQILCRVIT